MQNNVANKAIQPDQTKTKEVKKDSYHFSGSGKFRPMSVEAESREEAEKRWEEKREEIN